MKVMFIVKGKGKFDKVNKALYLSREKKLVLYRGGSNGKIFQNIRSLEEAERILKFLEFKIEKIEKV